MSNYNRRNKKADLEKRELPNDYDAERALISALLNYEEGNIRGTIIKTLAGVAKIFSGKDRNSRDNAVFYDVRHQYIFDVVCYMESENLKIDFLLIKSQLRQKGYLEEIGEEYLNDLYDESFVIFDSIEDYMDVVLLNYKYRMLYKIGGELQEKSKGIEEDPDTMMETVEDRIFKMKSLQQDESLFKMKDLVKDYFMQMTSPDKSKNRKITTGYPELDEKTGGLTGGQLVVLGGRPGMGKSSFALSMAYNMAKKTNKTILFYALEMSKEELLLKLISMASDVPHYKLKTNKIPKSDQAKLLQAADQLAKLNIMINDSSMTTPIELKAQAKNIKYLSEKSSSGEKTPPVGAIFIDYLQLLHVQETSMPREQQISYISRSLKQLAKDLSCPIIALSQLNRKVEDRTDSKPKISDLRESGAIEQDADKIMFVYRPHVYNKEEPASKSFILIEKQRDGVAPEELEFYWKPETTYFSELSKDDYYDVTYNESESGYEDSGGIGDEMDGVL